MSGINYRSIRDPILYVVDEHFKQKRVIASASVSSTGRGDTDTIPVDDILPDLPLLIIRNGNIVERLIHGNVELLGKDAEGDIIIWQEELIRDSEGKVVKIRTTYPDGNTADTEFISDNGKVVAVI